MRTAKKTEPERAEIKKNKIIYIYIDRLEGSMRIFAKTDIGRERKLDEDYFYA